MIEPATPAVPAVATAPGWPRRILPLTLTLGFGVALAVAAGLFVQRNERQRVAAEFDRRAHSLGETLRTNLQTFRGNIAQPAQCL